MIALGLVAAGCAWVVSGLAGGEGSTRLGTSALVGGASLVGLLPALVSVANRFGVAVMVASMARMLVVFVGALALTELAGHDRRPVWVGAASGAALLLMAETALAVLILSTIERNRLSRADNDTGEKESGLTC